MELSDSQIADIRHSTSRIVRQVDLINNGVIVTREFKVDRLQIIKDESRKIDNIFKSI